jgi:ribonuclease J
MIQSIKVEPSPSKLTLIPLGGQSELGQICWVFSYQGSYLLVDAGASYPVTELPGVDLLLPNLSFLEANQDQIAGLVLTNAHEEHIGAASFLMKHLSIPRVLGPKFATTFLQHTLAQQGQSLGETKIEGIELRQFYQVGPFALEWIQVNDAIADASALHVLTKEGSILYTSSFKFDQTPVDDRLIDMARLSELGDNGLLALISDSSGVESDGYTPSEKVVLPALKQHIKQAKGRVVVVVPGSNTHRLQLLFELAQTLGRKIILLGDTLIQTAIVAVMTGSLSYDRKVEASIDKIGFLKDHEILVVATGHEGDPFDMLFDLAHNKNKELSLRAGDTVIYSAEVVPGRSRLMANILDAFLANGIYAIEGKGVHVSKHASREELKLMLSIARPKFFIPAMGEGRHVTSHAKLAKDWGQDQDTILTLQNGQILEISSDYAFSQAKVEAASVFYNRGLKEKVTTYSVNERRALSQEGVITIGCLVNDSGKLLDHITIEGTGSGFLRSQDWLNLKSELLEMIENIVREHENPTLAKENSEAYISGLRAAIRELVNKSIRSKLQAKPVIQVVIHKTTSPAV